MARVFVYINVALFIFNLIPIPPLDGVAVLVGLLPPRRVEGRPVPRPVWGLDPHRADRLPSCRRSPRQASGLPECSGDLINGIAASWWAVKARQLGRHVAARVTPVERAALAEWLTPAQLALFDGMPVADRRHGLDVVAALPCAGVADRDVALAGLFHDAGKGRSIRLWHRVAWSLGELLGPWVHRLAAGPPAVRRRWRGCATTTRDRPSSPPRSAARRGPSPSSGRGGRRGSGRRGGARCAPRRRRGQLMALDPIAAPSPELPEVAFGDRRRPEDAIGVRLADWEGPIGLLLALVEARRLDVLTVPLGGLAEAYLDALATVEGERLANLSAVRRRGQPAHPHQEPGPPAAAARARRSRSTTSRTPRRRCGRGSSLYRAYRDAGDAPRRARRQRARPRPARARRGPGRRVARGGRAPAAAPRPRDPRRRARPTSPRSAPPDAAAGRGHPAHDHARRAGRPHPGGDRRGRPDRPPGAARRRPRPGRRRGHVPRDARAREAARDRRSSRTRRGGPSSCDRCPRPVGGGTAG